MNSPLPPDSCKRHHERLITTEDENVSVNSMTGFEVELELVPISLSKRLTPPANGTTDCAPNSQVGSTHSQDLLTLARANQSYLTKQRSKAMQVTHSHCAGIDVHKKTVVVCCLREADNGTLKRDTRSFGTLTSELLRMSEWLTNEGITQIAMESTGEYWKPVYNILESSFEVMVVNSHHFKQVPGRKTDVKDAEWLAELLRHGLVRGSLIPPLPQRDLRDLTRQRTTLVRERASVINRLQKVRFVGKHQAGLGRD